MLSGILLRYRRSRIGGTVIHNGKFPMWIGLPENTLNGEGQVLLAIIGRYDNRNSGMQTDLNLTNYLSAVPMKGFGSI
jgi:hypothetical protein